MTGFALHEEEASVVVRAGGMEVARYVFAEDAPAFEGPKPYLHPIRALSGAPLTGFRPWDHRWHRGLQMTLTDVSGQNFWGGNTYVHGRGYIPLDNVGRIRHDRFRALSDGPAAVIREDLTWITASGDAWLSEAREHRFHTLDPSRGLWALDIASTLRNTSQRELVLGSPTTNGRENAGYSGLFLRLTRSFTGGTVVAPDVSGVAAARAGAEADELMGSEAPWLAFSGLHDEIDGGGTVLAFAGRSSGSPAIRWFVRAEPFPVLAPSPTFAETVVLAPGEELALAHRLAFLDRVWEPDEVAALARELAP